CRSLRKGSALGFLFRGSELQLRHSAGSQSDSAAEESAFSRRHFLISIFIITWFTNVGAPTFRTDGGKAANRDIHPADPSVWSKVDVPGRTKKSRAHELCGSCALFFVVPRSFLGLPAQGGRRVGLLLRVGKRVRADWLWKAVHRCGKEKKVSGEWRVASGGLSKGEGYFFESRQGRGGVLRSG